MGKWRTNGFIEIEVLLSSVLVGILATAFVGTLIYSQQSLLMAGNRQRAVLLASEGVEAARNIRDGAWNELIYAQSAVQTSAGYWEFVGEGTDETLGNYTRTITFTDICRNSSNVIVSCPGDYTDVETKQVDVQVAWTTILGVPQVVAETTVLTNWDSAVWTQTDWSGGSGQSVWSVASQYESDDGNLEVSPSGQASIVETGVACGTTTWPFTSAGNYTYDTNDIAVTGGVAELIVSSGGASGFATPVLDSYEFAPSGATDTALYHISGNVYAVVYSGPGNDGYVQTVEITDAGVITMSVIDSLEFDTSNGQDPVMVQVSGTVYAIAYEDSNSDGGLVTVDIQADGTIGNSVIDFLEFDSGNGETPSIIAIDGNTFAIAYEDSGSDGGLVTVDIDASGNISSVIDYLEFDTSNGQTPDLTLVDGDTVLIAYEDTFGTGALATVDISSTGVIGSITDTFDFDLFNGQSPDVIEIAANRYAIAYEGSFGAGELTTIGVSDAGIIDAAVIDTLTVSSDAQNPIIVSLGNDQYAIAYEGASNDGFISLVDIQMDGTIGSVLDTFEFDNSNGQDIGLVYTGEVLIASYDGDGSDGFITAIGLTSSSSYPTDEPTIAPTTSTSVSAIDQWTSFTETATKNGGEVYYQLSDDDGTTWRYWDGSTWDVATITDYNTASVVDANIREFPVSSGTLLFRAFLESDGTQQVQLDEVSVTCATFQMEVGQVTVDEAWMAVNLVNEYVSPVVVASRYDPVNSLPASVRVRNAVSDSFEVRLQNPSDSALDENTVTYLVMEEGVWTHNTVRMEARLHETSTLGYKGNWTGDSMSYEQSYLTSPVVMHQLMSDNDSSWVTTFVSDDGTRTNPPDSNGFWLGLNAAEAATSHGATETIGWIAMEETAVGAVGSVVATYENAITSDSVQGAQNGCNNQIIAGIYATPPPVLVFQQELDGNDGGWAVQCSSSTTQTGLQIDEDQVSDSERSHTTETAAWIAFNQTFAYASGGTGGSGGGAYETASSLQSSAFDMGETGPLQTIAWDEDLSACPATCDIQVQVRTAPDDGGAPGVWTDWYGAGGSGTYFESGDEVLVSRDLNGNQWLQYRVELTSDGSATPILEEIRLNYR